MTALAAPNSVSANLEIDFYFDAVCPWSFVGKRRLEHAIHHRPGLCADIHWRPFLLNPELPQEGLDRTAYLIRKFGSEQRIKSAIGSVEQAGQSVEIDFAFDRIDKTPNTLSAHGFVRAASAQGKGDAAVESLFQAYFIDGQDIGDMAVLLRLANLVGIDEDSALKVIASDAERTAIFEENATAHRIGINGSPSFVFPGALAISGAQEPTVLLRLLDAAAASQAAVSQTTAS